MAADTPVEGGRTGPYTRADRLRARAEYRAIYAACAPIYTAHLVFYARPAPQGVRRLGCTVPKRTGNSVARNRLKRLIREAFRRERQGLPDGCDIVVNAKKSAAAMGYEEVREAFRKTGARLAREGFLKCAP